MNQSRETTPKKLRGVVLVESLEWMRNHTGSQMSPLVAREHQQIEQDSKQRLPMHYLQDLSCRVRTRNFLLYRFFLCLFPIFQVRNWQKTLVFHLHLRLVQRMQPGILIVSLREKMTKLCTRDCSSRKFVSITDRMK